MEGDPPYAHFHETNKCSATLLYADVLYHILPKQDNKYRMRIVIHLCPYIKLGFHCANFRDIFIDILYTEFYLNWTQNVQNKTDFFYAIK